MANPPPPFDINKNLATIVELLRQLLAIELYKNNVPKDIIGKRLHVAKAAVVENVKGHKKRW